MDQCSTHVIPDLYSVYLLQLIPKPRSFYIGSTPDPHRRLRQHNGDLKAGGAFKTLRKDYRPWKMVALVTGFPSKVSALQFEHALQHPYQTRHIQLVKRVSLLKTLGTSIHHKLANIRLLVESKFFSNFQLTIMIINDIKKEWNQNKFNLTSKHALFCESIENEVVPSRSVYYEEFKAKIIKDCPINCRFCTKVIDYVSEQPEVPIRTRLELDSFFKRGSLPLLACTPCDCKVISHLSCLAKFAANKEKVQIIPQQVSCPDCNGDMNWIDTVRVSTKLREYFLST